jgi:hypothetical protein
MPDGPTIGGYARPPELCRRSRYAIRLPAILQGCAESSADNSAAGCSGSEGGSNLARVQRLGAGGELVLGGGGRLPGPVTLRGPGWKGIAYAQCPPCRRDHQALFACGPRGLHDLARDVRFGAVPAGHHRRLRCLAQVAAAAAGRAVARDGVTACRDRGRAGAADRNITVRAWAGHGDGWRPRARQPRRRAASRVQVTCQGAIGRAVVRGACCGGPGRPRPGTRQPAAGRSGRLSLPLNEACLPRGSSAAAHEAGRPCGHCGRGWRVRPRRRDSRQ